jgi:transcriptional regulator with XRE-family HTH domain
MSVRRRIFVTATPRFVLGQQSEASVSAHFVFTNARCNPIVLIRLLLDAFRPNTGIVQRIASRRAIGYAPMVPRHLEQPLKKLLYETVLSLGNQARFAETIGVNQATVSRWISGEQGMDLGACLRLAKLTRHPLPDILLWANHNPEDYLDSDQLPPLSADAQSIADRARLLLWERRRKSVAVEIRPFLDNAVEAVIGSFQEATDVFMEPPEDTRPS